MSKQANPTLIGAFVLGAISLAVITTLLLAGGSWFGDRQKHVLYFDGAAQGLQVGAPVVFLGVKVGTVKQIQLGLNEKSHRFLVSVIIEIEPHVVHARGIEPVDLRDRATVHQLVERGLRGQLRMQSLLTGQLYVDLDFHPDKLPRYARTTRSWPDHQASSTACGSSPAGIAPHPPRRPCRSPSSSPASR